MPQRIPINEQEQPTPFLRRSPRLYQENQIKAEAATKKKPNTEKRKSRAPSSSTPKVTLQKKKKNTLKYQPRESPQKLHNSLRKSTRLSGKRNTQKKSEQEGLLGLRKSELGDDLPDQFSKKSATRRCNRGNAKIASAGKTGKGKGNASIRCITSIEFSTKRDFPDELEKRVTRSSSRENTSKVDASNQFSEKKELSVRSQPKDQPGVKSAKQEKKMEKNTYKPGQRNGRSKRSEFIQCGPTEILDKQVLSNEGRSKLGFVVDLSEEFTGKLRNRTRNGAGTSSPGIENGGEREEKDIPIGNKHIGVKRKKNQVEEDNGIVQGWNADQEIALQGAYLATKPTPHFWKKVARLVPGKSAQECFDKVHSDHLTPPQLQPRTRARTNSSSSLSSSLLASDFLKSPVLNDKNKRKSHLSHKALRQLLQKSYQVDPNYEADLFSVLEPTSNPPPLLSTPERKPESLLKKCQQRSSSLVHKKEVSRFSRAGLVSPPVLKQVKNKVLHEKYIDQLRSREAKRKATSSRAIKCSKKGEKEDRKVGHAEKMDAIKAAKNALVFDARDAIKQFQNIQANALSSSFSDEEEDEGEEEEDEDRG